MIQLAKIIGLLIWASGLLALYTIKISVTPIPPVAALMCGGGEFSALCQNLYLFYFYYYAAITVLYVGAVLVFRDFWRPTVLLLLTGAGCYFIQAFTFEELKAVQTYSYEVFIIAFYHWALWMVILLAAACMLPRQRKIITLITLLLTVACTVLFTIQGRGSVEHITPLLGGLLADISWDMLGLSVLAKLLVMLMVGAVLIYPLLAMLAIWVRHGKVTWRVWPRGVVYGVVYSIIALIPITSIPAGMQLNNKDIDEAKQFVDQLLPQIEEYQKEHKEYPQDLSQVVDLEAMETPRLLDIYEYIAYGTEGAYYLSRPEKYCIIFQNPGKDFGYYSLTSDRKWKFFSERQSLARAYETICDESGNLKDESLIAGHLGLPNPDDPLAALGAEVGDVVQPAMTQGATPLLEKQIHELGYKNPEIYATKPMIPEEEMIGPEELLERLKKQPLHTR